MPTGYTQALYDGEQGFDKFMVTLARGMGALITMRDEPWDAPIPDTFEPETSYYDRQIEEAETDLHALETMTVEEGSRRAQGEHHESVQRFDRERARRKAVRARYVEMLEKVEAWHPPTADHRGLRDFAISQIEESIRFDCGGMEHWPVAPLLTGEEWMEKQRTKDEATLARAQKERREAVQRAEERTAWVRALRGSLEADRVG